MTNELASLRRELEQSCPKTPGQRPFRTLFTGNRVAWKRLLRRGGGGYAARPDGGTWQLYSMLKGKRVELQLQAECSQ